MIILYHTVDLNNVINKQLTEKMRHAIKLKADVVVYQPVITMRISKTLDELDVNYAYIEELERFYFITDIELTNENIYKLYMECDVLETYRDDILNGTGFIQKEISEGDYAPVSTSDDVRKTSEIFENTEVLQRGRALILSTIGG